MAFNILLDTDFINHYHLKSRFSHNPMPMAIVPVNTTSSEEFDVSDKNGAQPLPVNSGVATYKNPNGLSLHLLDYESFINSLPKYIQNGKKRPDLICESESNEWFIINELSTGAARNKHSDALKQFQGALNDLYNVQSIADYIDAKQHKMCVISIRKSPLPAQVAAFDINNQLINKPIERKFQQITKRNFVTYETDMLVIDSQFWQ